MLNESLKNHTFVSNTIYNVIYKIISAIFPFVMTAYASNILEADGIGRISIVQNFVTYFTMIAALGIPNYGIKVIAKSKNLNQRSQSFWELFYINFFSTSVCIVIYFFVVFSRKYDFKMALIFSSLIFFNYVNIDWFYSGIEEFRYITIRSFIVKILALIFTFIYVKNNSDYYVYAIILCFTIGANNIVNIFLIKKYINFISIWKCDFVTHIKSIFLLFLTSISVELYSLLDVSMLGIFGTNKIVGYYTTASKFVKVPITLLVSISGALLPRLTLYYNNNNIRKCEELITYIFNILLSFAIPCGVGMFIISSSAIPLIYGIGFKKTISTVKILSFLFFCLTFSNLFGTQILLTVGEEKKLCVATFFGMIINVILNLLLIPSYRNNGAAIASVVSEIIVTFITFRCSKKYFKLHVKKSLL